MRVHVRHSTHNFASQSSHSVELVGKQRMLPLNFGYYDAMPTGPIGDVNHFSFSLIVVRRLF